MKKVALNPEGLVLPRKKVTLNPEGLVLLWKKEIIHKTLRINRKPNKFTPTPYAKRR